MEVFQKFSIRSDKYGEVFVVYKRLKQNERYAGHIHDLSYLVPSIITGSVMVTIHNEEIPQKDCDLIHKRASDLWNEFMT